MRENKEIVVTTSLTQTQITQFNELGYLVVDCVLDPEYDGTAAGRI